MVVFVLGVIMKGINRREKNRTKDLAGEKGIPMREEGESMMRKSKN